MSTEFINDQWRLPNAWNGSESNVNKQSNYSMDFDGSSKINCGTANTYNEFTLSAWIKKDSTAPNYAGIFGTRNSTAAQWPYLLSLDNTGKVRFIADGTTSVLSDSAINNDTWYHIVGLGDGTNLKLYINGQLQTATATYTTPLQSANNDLMIGGQFDTDSSSLWVGQIDAVAIFNYALSSSQVTTLYGSSSTGIGNPMSLSPKPVASYNLGDKSAFNSANYLVPNIAAQEADGDIAVSYSPYALDFDSASSDYIDCGDSDDFSFGDGTTDSPFSVSFFVNLNSYPQYNCVFVSKDDGSPNREYGIGMFGNRYVKFFIKNQGGNYQQSVDSTTTIALGSWYHVVATYDGRGTSNAADGMNLYINSINETTGLFKQPYTAMANTTAPFRIGQYANVAYVDGKISNVSVWNTELTSAQVSEIYNEGVPSNLNNHSAYSNLVSWWQLGSNSSFNTNWTVLDEKGSNNGTSVNMTEVDIVDGVGSYANGLSSGMGGDEVIGSAPFSDANSLSVNMDVLDRVEDTPS